MSLLLCLYKRSDNYPRNGFIDVESNEKKLYEIDIGVLFRAFPLYTVSLIRMSFNVLGGVTTRW